MRPKHFDGIGFQAVGGQVKQNQTSGRIPHNNVYLIILMDDVVIPSDIKEFPVDVFPTRLIVVLGLP